MDRCSSLLRKFVNYGEKKFYNIVTSSNKAASPSVEVVAGLAGLVLRRLLRDEDDFRISPEAVQFPDRQFSVRLLVPDLEVILDRKLRLPPLTDFLENRSELEVARFGGARSETAPTP